MATTADTVARLEKLRAILPFPADLLDGVQHLTNIYGALVNDGVSAGRKSVVGYRHWLMRWAISPELTGPVDGPLPQSDPEPGTLPDAPPIQAWMDSVVKTLDKLRECLTPDVVDALAQGRREGNRFGILRARSYVQALHETMDSLAYDTNIVLCRVSAAPDEDPADEKLKPQTISLPELHLVMFPGGSRADGLARQVRELVDRWTDLKYDFQKDACRWNLVEEVSATLIAVKTTESGLNSAQQLLVDARARADEIVEAVSDWYRRIHDRNRAADPLEIIRSVQIETKLRDLERIPCEEMGVDGRMVSGQFNRVEGYVRRLATEVRAFLGEISAAEEDPEMYADPGYWFTARDFNAVDLELAVAINEAVLSHWGRSEYIPDPVSVACGRETEGRAAPPDDRIGESNVPLAPVKTAKKRSTGNLAEELGVRGWKDIALVVTIDGVRAKRVNAPGRMRSISMDELGLGASKEARRLLIELAMAGGVPVPHDGDNSRRVLVHRINSHFKKAFGIKENCFRNQGGIITESLSGSISWEGKDTS